MSYPSDLTDAQWQLLEPLLPVSKATSRPRKWELRLVLNAIFYLLRSGCAWRLLPHESPPWPTVHDTYRRLRRDGTWERIHAQLREQVRVSMGRKASPSGAILDSQSVKTTEKGALVVRPPWGMMPTRKLRGASVTCWWIPRDWYLKSS